MNFNSTYGIAAIVAGSIAIATMMTSNEASKLESRLSACSLERSPACPSQATGPLKNCLAAFTGQCADIKKADMAARPA